MRPARIIIVGECMVELSAAPGGLYRLGFGGDTLNTAIYVCRLLGQKAQLSYMTKLGGDPFSVQALRSWASEGINLNMTEIVADRTIGFYAISTDDKGERSFTYWRDASPARDLLSGQLPEDQHEAMISCDLLYFSGISLAILTESARRQLLEIAQQARSAGALVVFDPNHRPRLWQNRAEERKIFQMALEAASIVLTSWDEQQAIFGDATHKSVIARLADAGVGESVIRDGAGPVTLRLGKQTKKVNFREIAAPQDTTGAGDSFNAAYICARLCGTEPVRAAKTAQALAAAVIMHSGAILPTGAMPDSVMSAFSTCQPVLGAGQPP